MMADEVKSTEGRIRRGLVGRGSGMSTIFKGIVAITLTLSLGGVAWAQDAGAKVKEINFEDDTIEGELQMPNQTNIRGDDMGDLSSLIKAREDFVDEMLKSVEDL